MIGFLGPHGPSSVDTHGLLISITLLLQDATKRIERSKSIFFIAIGNYIYDKTGLSLNLGTQNKLFNVKFMFKKTLVIGLGLIGGSFAKAIRQANLSREIFACDSDQETIDYAKSLKVIDGGFTGLDFFADELKSFDFIVVATPLSVYDEVFFEIKDVDALVIDLGSIKDLDLEYYPKNFIPCHPIAGSENTGFEFSDEKLFFGKKFLFCKKDDRATEVIKKIGAIPDFIDSKTHDEIYALVSHLPQFLSFLTVEFSPKKLDGDFFEKAFRLNNSDPEIWSDIIAINEKNLEKFYDKFFDNLEKNISSEILTTLSEGRDLAKSFASATMVENKFFEENFVEIFFRALIAKSFLEISEIKNYKSYAGSGFKDFASIIAVFNYDTKKLENLFAQKRGKILNFFKSLQ